MTVIADRFEHYQLAGFNDGDGLGVFDVREALQRIINGVAAFECVNQVLQRDAPADKDGGAAHVFGIGADDIFQILQFHHKGKILLSVELSPANKDVM